ncbi:hypothetical protein HMPREF3159_12015 [Brachybacterium sp. HMSC06H03]|uniref:hypothetical protein n=1 Tax=Brachybacterium sp. HMSC06H03 TaxID=1581127 RepID=UPI0008A53CEC|nr:hypothetical protein [Brachybacterium sp. HMSC06H03]OFT50735.1 hypothetical protein HMPREF3159_12015 [Brachybacterium sp. HMSC06H03]
MDVDHEIQGRVAARHVGERPVPHHEGLLSVGDHRALKSVQLLRTALDERDRDDVFPSTAVGGESTRQVYGLTDIALAIVELEGVDPAELTVQAEIDARRDRVIDLPAALEGLPHG